MMGVFVFVLLAMSLDVARPDVPILENNEVISQPRFTSLCNASITYDRVLLKRITLLSKYIFTGKVSGVSRGGNDSWIYSVNIRRVLKGDLNDIGIVVKFGGVNSLRFSDATVLVEGSGMVCRPLRLRTYAIFLSEKKQSKRSMTLSLVVEPVLMTLRNIEIVEAAVKVLFPAVDGNSNQQAPGCAPGLLCLGYRLQDSRPDV